VHDHGAKLVCLVLATLYSWGVGLACILALLKLSLGG
jgi:hypothetical protein